jgi:radical SAM protein with 4Fe4S-binding SPASM domain
MTGTPGRSESRVAPSPAAGGRAPRVQLRELDINVTNRCNLQCLHCSYASTPRREEPSLSGPTIRRIMVEARALGNEVVHWSGGEPLLRPDMGELVEHGAALGYRMRLLSNGALLTPEALAGLWRRGLRKIFVSVDGLEASHDFHRASPGLFARTLKGVDSALAGGFNVRVNAVATTGNVGEMPSLLRMMAARGVHIFTVFYLIPVGRGRDIVHLQVPPARWRRLVEELREAAGALPPGCMEVAVEKVFWWEEEWAAGRPLAGGRGGGCLGFLDACDYLNILADGRVYPCVCFIDVAPPLGNVHERGLAEILHDPASWTFYWSMRTVNATCAACPMVDPCGGGNRPSSRAVRGDWLAMDPRCGGDPYAQGFVPLCFMLREQLGTGLYSGFEDGAAPPRP